MADPESFEVVRSRQIDADNAWAKAHIEKAENWLDDQADRQRALIPPNDYVGLSIHDGTLGIVKTAYHLAKGLLGLAMDVGRLKDDPVYRENVAQKVWNGAVWLAKEAYISQGHAGPEAVQDQNERVIAFSKGLWDKAKKGWEEAGTKPGHQTQLVVEIAANIALFFVGGEAATATRAEKLEEGAAILEEVTQPCKTIAKAEEEAAALAKAKAAEEEAAALAKAKAAEEEAAAKAAGAAERAAIRTELEDIARKRATELKATLSNRERGPVLTVLKDKKTGQIFEGMNVDSVPEDLHPILKQRLADLKNPVHPSTPGTHAEVIAIDKALKAREAAGMTVTEADLGDFIFHNETLWSNKVGSVPCCANCTPLTKGADSLSGTLTTFGKK
jgi:tRNA(Arg) A34 adenosine deaminase TadA